MSEVLLHQKVNELKEDLSAEREIRSKNEQDLKILKTDIAEMDVQLEEANSIKDREAESSKRLRQEIADLKQKIDSQNTDTEESIALTRRKHQETINELTAHMETINKNKLKFEKESKNFHQQCEDLRYENETLAKARSVASASCKDLEHKLCDQQQRIDDSNRQINELNENKAKITSQNNEFKNRTSTLENELQQSNLNNKKICQDIEEARMQTENEMMLRMSMENKNRNLQSDYETLKGQCEEETEIKIELQRQIVRIQEEFRLNREKYEKECSLKVEEFEDSKRRGNSKFNDLQNQFTDLLSKNSTIEKSKMKLQNEIDHLQQDIEKFKKKSEESVKREKHLITEIDELKNKMLGQSTEIQSGEQNARLQSAEISKHKHLNDQLMEQLEAFQREKRRLTDELENANNQLLEVQGRLVDTERKMKSIETDRQQLQDDLDDQKDNIQAETTRYQNLSQNIEKIKLENDRRLSEKDDEIDVMKIAHKRQLESSQTVSDEIENKYKTELSLLKKKFGSELEEALMQLEIAKKSKSDADINIKKLMLSNKEITDQLLQEQNSNETSKELLVSSDKRNSSLKCELEETKVLYERSEKNKKSIEHEYQELEEKVNDYQNQLAKSIGDRKKFEAEALAAGEELQEIRFEMKNTEDRIRNTTSIILKKDEDIRAIKEEADEIDLARKSVEGQLKDLQSRVDEAEEFAKREAKRMGNKLETRCAQIEDELEMEKSKESEYMKELRNMEMHNKKLVDQLNEDQSKLITLTDAYEKLYEKTKKYKAQIEQAEEQVAINASKSKRLQRELEDAEDRAESVTKSFLSSRRSSVTKNLECDSDYGDDSLSQYSIVSQTPSYTRSYLRDQHPSQSLNSRRGSVNQESSRPPSMSRQSSVSRMMMGNSLENSRTARASSISRYANKIKSLDMMMDDDDASSISSSHLYNPAPLPRYSTSTLLTQTPRNDRARSISSMAKDTDYEQSTPPFANSSNRRYNFYTSRKTESRPESRSGESSRLSDSRKSESRQEIHSLDLELDKDREDEAPSSFLKEYHARKNRITGGSQKKYEKYKTYTDQISKLTNKYSQGRGQISPESDSDLKSSEVLEKNISLGPERSVTPTPLSEKNDENTN